MAAAALILAQAADAITFEMMPRWAEANSLAAHLPSGPVAKAALVLLVLSAGYMLAASGRKRLGEALYLAGALAGAFGAGANASVLTALGA